MTWHEGEACCDQRLIEYSLDPPLVERQRGRGSEPHFHPASGRLAFVVREPQGEGNLFIHPAVGGDRKLITPPEQGKGYSVAAPTWSPSGQWVAGAVTEDDERAPSTILFLVAGENDLFICSECRPATYGASDDVLYVHPRGANSLVAWNEAGVELLTIDLPGEPVVGSSSWHLTGMGAPPPR